MKIVYCLIDSSQSGGMERSICCKANYLADVMGEDVTIITTDKGSNDNFFDFSFKIHFIDLGINYKELAGLSFLKRLKVQIQKRKKHRSCLGQVLKELQADIVISTCTHEVSILYKIKDGSHKIAECHLSKDYKRVEAKLMNQPLLQKCFTWLTDFRRKQSFKYYDCLVVLSENEKKQWKGYNDHIVSIPNPLPFFPKTVADYTSKRVISVGRLSKEKGFTYLINAWQSVYQKYPDWELAIFGGGRELNSLEKQIHDLGMESTVRIYPPTKNIEQEYMKSSLYVMPSVSEAFGLVLLEAMACGLPCVAFDSGFSDIIKDGLSGFLVETKDVERLSEKIIFLIESDQVRHYMGQSGKNNTLRFLPENIMPQWMDLFAKIIKK